MISKDNFPIYCVKDVVDILRISPATLHRIRKQAGLKTNPSKRKTRYTMQEIEQIAEFIRIKNNNIYENN